MNARITASIDARPSSIQYTSFRYSQSANSSRVSAEPTPKKMPRISDSHGDAGIEGERGPPRGEDEDDPHDQVVDMDVAGVAAAHPRVRATRV